MTFYDLKAAYKAHIQTLNDEQKRAFGRQILQAIGNTISRERNKLPPLGANEIPFTPEQHLGPRITKLTRFATALQNGMFSDSRKEQMGDDDFDEMFEDALDEVFDGITDRDAAVDNHNFNYILIEAKDPAGFASGQAEQTAREFRVDQEQLDRDYYFNSESNADMIELFGDDRRLTEEEIKEKREANSEERTELENKIAAMLIDAYSGCNNREDLNNAYNKIMPVFISPKHQVGLKLKTGIDMEDVVRHGLTRAQNRGYSRRGGLNRETLNAELREAAKAIANADIFMYYADKIDGIDKFLKEGNRVKVAVRFRGREMAHTEIGEALLKLFAEKCAEIAVLDKAPKLEGRNMTIFLSPKPVAQPKKPAKPKQPKPQAPADEVAE